MRVAGRVGPCRPSPPDHTITRRPSPAAKRPGERLQRRLRHRPGRLLAMGTQPHRRPIHRSALRRCPPTHLASTRQRQSTGRPAARSRPRLSYRSYPIEHPQVSNLADLPRWPDGYPSSRTSVPRGGTASALIRFVKRHSPASERRKAVRIESGWLHSRVVRKYAVFGTRVRASPLEVRAARKRFRSLPVDASPCGLGGGAVGLTYPARRSGGGHEPKPYSSPPPKSNPWTPDDFAMVTAITGLDGPGDQARGRRAKACGQREQVGFRHSSMYPSWRSSPRTGEGTGSARATRSARSPARSAASRRRARGAARTRSACQHPGSSEASRPSATTPRPGPSARAGGHNGLAFEASDRQSGHARR